MSKNLFMDILAGAAKGLVQEAVKQMQQNEQTQQRSRPAAQRRSQPQAKPRPKAQSKGPKLPSKSDPLRQVKFKNYKKNPHVDLDGQEKGGFYHLDYDFQDHKGKTQSFQVKYNMKRMREMAAQFGFPRSYMGSFRMSQAQVQQFERDRQRAMKEGLFMLQNNQLRPDPSSIVTYYAEEFCEPIAHHLVRILDNYGTDTRRERIELAMKFVQDIPYAIPHQNDPEYLYCGVVTPPQILYLKFGDCDSKSFLFAGILTYLIPPTDVGFLELPGHLLTVIRDQPAKGMTSMKSGSDTYIVAETAGPGRIPFGKPAKYKKGKMDLVRLNYKGRNSILPYGNTTATKTKGYQLFRAPQKPVDSSILKALAHFQSKKQPIKSIVFNDDGGWLVIAGKNSFQHKNIPRKMVSSLTQLAGKGHEITDAALNDQDEFVIVYHDGFGYTGALHQKNGQQLNATMNEITEKHGQPIRDVMFTHHKAPGWIMTFGKHGNGFTAAGPQRFMDKLKATMEKAAKSGIKNVAFTQNGGWVVVYGKNDYSMMLTDKAKKMVGAVFAKLKEQNASVERIYFTATDEVIVVYNGYHVWASFKA